MTDIIQQLKSELLIFHPITCLCLSIEKNRLPLDFINIYFQNYCLTDDAEDYIYLLSRLIYHNYENQIVRLIFEKMPEKSNNYLSYPESFLEYIIQPTLKNGNYDKYIDIFVEYWKKIPTDRIIHNLSFTNLNKKITSILTVAGAAKILKILFENTNDNNIQIAMTLPENLCLAVNNKQFECADVILDNMTDNNLKYFTITNHWEHELSKESIDYYVNIIKNKMPKIDIATPYPLLRYGFYKDNEYAFDQAVEIYIKFIKFEITNFNFKDCQLFYDYIPANDREAHLIKYEARYQELLKKHQEEEKEEKN
jgi:hypothetical protein